MARTQRIKTTGNGVEHYHLMSRTNDKRFLFGKAKVKDKLVDTLKRASAFCGIKVEAYVIMDNHFHIVCKVTRTNERLSEDELLNRIAIIKGAKFTDELYDHWKDLKAAGLYDALEASKLKYEKRMNDISEFMKLFKEMFNLWYKKHNDYCGSLWSARFASTLIKGDKYRATCKRYVELNPVRAKMVNRAADYRWSSWSETQVVTDEEMPIVWGEKRIPQIGMGKVLGSREDVAMAMIAIGHLFRTTVAPRRVEGECFSTHGYKWMAKGAKRG